LYDPNIDIYFTAEPNPAAMLLLAPFALALAPAGWVGRGAVGSAPLLPLLRSCRCAPRAPPAACDESVAEREFREQRHEWESLPNPHFEYNAAEDLWVLDGAAAVEQYTAALKPHFDGLRQRPFFRYYSVDLMASCSYLPQVESPLVLERRGRYIYTANPVCGVRLFTHTLRVRHS
jgi:hypothetical protein